MDIVRNTRPVGATSSLLLFLIAIGAMTTPAQSADRFFNPFSGLCGGSQKNFLNNTCWTGNTPPGTTDRAIFNAGATTPYQVFTTNNMSNASAVIKTDQLVWTFSPYTYTLGNDLTVGETSGDNANLSIFSGTVSSNTGFIARDTGSTGLLTLANATWNVGDSLYVGGNSSAAGGSGTLTINSGAQLTVTNLLKVWDDGVMNLNGGTVSAGSLDSLTAGEFYFTGGTLNINGGTFSEGSNSLVINSTTGSPVLNLNNGASATYATGNISPGNTGSGTININSGSSITGANSYIGNAATGVGTLSVNGTGSALTVSNELRIGNSGTGTLTISNGTVSSASTTLGTLAGSDGTASLSSTQAVLTTGALTVGDGGSGDMDILLGTVSSTSGIIGNAGGSGGTVTLGNTAAFWNNTGTLDVGVGGTGLLELLGGADFSGTDITLGVNSGGNGTIDLSNGSVLTAAGELVIGDAGSGALNTVNGATINSTQGYLGRSVGGTALMTLTGSSSNWINSGDITIADAGSATLNITGGATVSSANGFIGRSSTGNGTGILSSGGNWQVADSLYIGGNSGAGSGGSAQLNLNTGGILDVANLTRLWGGTLNMSGGTLTTGSLVAAPGSLNFASGTITVDGAGGSFSDGNTDLVLNSIVGGANPTLELVNTVTADYSSGDIVIGNTSMATLLLGNGATLTGTNADIGLSAGGDGTATVTGSGSGWNNSGALNVAVAGNGSLNISAGASVSADHSSIGIGGGSGAITLSDSASSLTIADILLMGNGTISISNGATLDSLRGYLGFESNSTSTVTLADSASSWNITNELSVGSNGVGHLNINGGSVSSAAASVDASGLVFSSLNINGSQSGLASTGSLVVGDNGKGSMNITNSGTASSDSGFIGRNGGSTGNVTLSTGGYWQIGDSLYLGGNTTTAGGNGNLTVNAGSSLGVANLLRVWTAGSSVNLNGGTITTGSYTGVAGTLNLVDGRLTVNGTGGAFHDGESNLVIESGNGGHSTLELANGVTSTYTGDVNVGVNGAGTLELKSGATLTNGGVANIGSAGSVTLSGENSGWTVAGDLNMQGFGAGSGAGMLISSGADLQTLNADIGKNDIPTSGITLTGTGTTWANSGTIILGENGGTGTVAASNGAAITTFDMILGDSSSLDVHGTGTALISGTGTLLDVTGNLLLGTEGSDGSLTVNGGATLQSGFASIGRSLDGASQGGSSNVTLSDAGTSWVNTASLYIGELAYGELFIQNGASVSNHNAYLGDGPAGTGVVTVDGANSTWTNTGNLSIGSGTSGFGSLGITNGGSATHVDVLIASGPSSDALVTVSNPGSSLTSNGTIYVGGDAGIAQGTGRLQVLDGGLVNSTGLVVYSNDPDGVFIRNTGSTLNTGLLGVGPDSTAYLRVNDSGTLTSTSAKLGENAGGNGGIDVYDFGVWTNSGDLYVGGNALGSGGAGNLDIGLDGSLTNTGTLRVWNNASNVNLAGGTITTGSFHAFGGTLNFTDGLLRVNGAGGIFDDGNTDLVISDSTVGNNPTLWLNNTVTADYTGGTVRVGESGTGTLKLDSGASLASQDAYIGRYGSGTGNVELTGSGTSWNNTGTLAIGSSSGAGGLLVRSGATASSASTIIEEGWIILQFAGATFNSSTSLFVGRDDASGALSNTGGTINSGDVFIGDSSFVGAQGSGIATLAGTGSSWNINGDMHIGFNGGNGNLTIEQGGEISNTDGFVGHGINGDFESGVNKATVDGSGSTWSNSGSLFVGYNASGELLIQNGGSVTSQDGYIGDDNLYAALVTVDGPGSGWANSNGLYVGSNINGDGTLAISNGGTVSNGDGFLGYAGASTGTATVSGVGSLWDNSGSLYIGGDTTGAQGSGILNIIGGGHVSVADTLTIWNTGSVNLSGGYLSMTTLDNQGGGFAFNSGQINLLNDFNVGLAGPLGDNVTLTSSRMLSVGGTTTIDPFSMLTLNGGTFATGDMINNGTFDFLKGTFNLTTAAFTLGNSGLFGSSLLLDGNRVINVSTNVNIDSNAVLFLDNGTFTGGSITNNGQIVLDGPLAHLGGNNLYNNSLINGDGRISTVLTNNSGGEISVAAGDTLRFTGAGNTNSGDINLSDGTARFDQDMINTSGGVIAGRGTLIANGGLTNQGNIGFSSGSTDIFGDVNNATGGAIIVSGNATATFFDDLIHNGTEIRVSDGSNAVFFGNVSGSGSYTGTGSLFFEGDLNPGNSPGMVNVEGDMVLGTSARTIMELGGLWRGTEYDAFDVGGTLSLDGLLEVSLYDLGGGPFDPQPGDSFDLFLADTILGSFNDLSLAALGNGLGWQVDILPDAIGLKDALRLSVVSAVPLPPAVWMFLAGLLWLAGIARRRTA